MKNKNTIAIFSREKSNGKIQHRNSPVLSDVVYQLFNYLWGAAQMLIMLCQRRKSQRKRYSNATSRTVNVIVGKVHNGCEINTLNKQVWNEVFSPFQSQIYFNLIKNMRWLQIYSFVKRCKSSSLCLDIH